MLKTFISMSLWSILPFKTRFELWIVDTFWYCRLNLNKILKNIHFNVPNCGQNSPFLEIFGIFAYFKAAKFSGWLESLRDFLNKLVTNYLYYCQVRLFKSRAKLRKNWKNALEGCHFEIDDITIVGFRQESEWIITLAGLA